MERVARKSLPVRLPGHRTLRPMLQGHRSRIRTLHDHDEGETTLLAACIMHHTRTDRCICSL